MRSPIRATRSSDKIVVERSNGTHVSVLTVAEARDLVLQLKVAIDPEPLNEIHPCTKDHCNKDVPYDDEPYCYEHSPMSGSNVLGYSYRDVNTCKYTPLLYASPTDAARVVVALTIRTIRDSTSTVEFLNSLSNVTGHFSDSMWGWNREQVLTFKIKDVENGYELVLPDPCRI